MRSRLLNRPWIGRTTLPVLITCAALVGLPHPPCLAQAVPSTAGASDPSSVIRQLSLAEARQLALTNSELLQQAAEAIAGAEADVTSATAGKLPHLDLGGVWTRNLKKPVFFLPPELSQGGPNKVEMGGDFDLQAGLSLTLNLWTAGRLSAVRGAALEVLEATRWQERLVADAVLYTVEAAYFDVLLADLELMIAERSLIDAEEALRITKAEFSEGTVSNFDLLRSEVELANRQVPLITTRNTQAVRTYTLLRVCGLDPATPVALSDSLTAVPDPGPVEPLLDLMHASSSELKLLNHAVAAQQQAVRLAKAGRGPILQLQGGYTVQGQWDDDVSPAGEELATSGTAALAVSIPIFDGLQAKGEIGRSQADLRVAETELTRVTRDRELSVRQARLYLENALAALDGRQEGVNLAGESHRLALVRFENGLATPLERLDAELALIEARVQYANALHVCNVARSALRLAVGADLTNPDSASGAQEESE